MSPIIASAAMAGTATRRQRLSTLGTAPTVRAKRREETNDSLYATANALLGIGTVLLFLGAVGAWMS